MTKIENFVRFACNFSLFCPPKIFSWPPFTHNILMLVPPLLIPANSSEILHLSQPTSNFDWESNASSLDVLEKLQI